VVIDVGGAAWRKPITDKTPSAEMVTVVAYKFRSGLDEGRGGVRLFEAVLGKTRRTEF